MKQLNNPYSALPRYSDWRKSVAGVEAAEFDPVVRVPFQIGLESKVATAGSCFAQHISRTLLKEGFRYLVTESAPSTIGAVDEGYGVFPARFANIYTVRQLLQLFQRAYGLFDPADSFWRRIDGRYLDPFRPRIQKDGFASHEEVERDRQSHLNAVRSMFEQCDIFVFTLGLTEAWVSNRDGAVFPLAPGVVKAIGVEGDYRFHNFSVDSMVNDLAAFVDAIRVVNKSVKLIFTVSPVPLIATYEDRHVLVSTTASKAALRVVADTAERNLQGVTYFPSYEIVTGPHVGNRYFAPDLREVTSEGVAHVMRIFKKHFLTQSSVESAPEDQHLASCPPTDWQRMKEMSQVICDEEAIVS